MLFLFLDEPDLERFFSVECRLCSRIKILEVRHINRFVYANGGLVGFKLRTDRRDALDYFGCFPAYHHAGPLDAEV